MKREVEELVEEFDQTYSLLASQKDAPLMVFDTCMHSGSAMRPILKTLKAAGYSDVKVGLAQPEEKFRVKVNFVALYKRTICYPFGTDFIVNKRVRNILSLPNSATDDRYALEAISVSKANRRRIKDLFRN